MTMRELLPAVCLIALLALDGCGRERYPLKSPAAASSLAGLSHADKRHEAHAYVAAQGESRNRSSG